MFSAVNFAVLATVLIGHAALWVALFNRLHAKNLPHWVVRSVGKVYLSIMVGGGGVLLLWGWRVSEFDPPAISGARLGLALYVALCCGVGLVVASIWLTRYATTRPLLQLISNDTETLDIAAELGDRPAGDRFTRLLDYVPGHQMFKLHIHEKKLTASGLPRALDGLSIAHFSDLHFTGHIKQSYFDSLVDHVNQLDADLVAITGDLIDNSKCVGWLTETLGRLQSRHGVFFLLGNHDKRQRNSDKIRQIMTECGFVDLGRETRALELNGCRLLLAGNELPWLGPPPDLPPMSENPNRQDYRLLLSHSPDQFQWARERGFDLMLAGHTHGGQIRLPLIGPIVSPSKFGVKYASGLFYEPPTLLHVTRGISGKDPIRWNCPPELAKLVLHA